MEHEPDHRIDELEGQMEAADSLIKGLEEEVEGLRRDLAQASDALRIAQQEVSARERSLEGQDLARIEAEQQVRSLRDSIGDLRMQNSDEQLQLRNQHIAELARMQDKFGAQRIYDTGKKFSGNEYEGLKEEYRSDLQRLQERYQGEIEALEDSYAEWKDSLLEDERELKERHEVEIQEIRRETEGQKKELRRQLRDETERRIEEERQTAASRYEEKINELRQDFEERSQEVQEERDTLVAEHQAALEALREQTDRRLREADERHKGELREIKALAENRERELRRTQSAKVKEAGEEAERRLASLQAQRKADNEALRSNHEKEVSSLKREHGELLDEEIENRRQEVLFLEEKLESVKLERTSEARAYIDRLKELEAPHQVAQNGQAETKTNPRRNADSNVGTEGREAVEAEILNLRGRVSELEEALASSRSEVEQLATELERAEARPTVDAPVQGPKEPEPPEEATGETEDRTEQLRIRPPGPEGKKPGELEARLREVQEERRYYADELGKALDKLRRLSDPEHRLRAGIAAFNESYHARNVASISKALGLPGVHAGVSGESPGKPTFTFMWEISWRRYIADPIEGLEEPKVYLVAGGDDPEQSPPPDDSPNARIDARGRLILGIRDR